MPTVVDARGKRHRLYRPPPPPLSDRHDPAVRAAAESWDVAKKEARSRPVVFFLPFLGLIATILAVVGPGLSGVRSIDSLRHLAPLLYLCFPAYTGATVWWLASRRAGVVAREMRSRGLCPACGYMIDPAGGNTGETLCPECGAVWGKMDERGRTVVVVRDRKNEAETSD